MLESHLGTVLFGIVRNLPGDAVSRRGDQQAERKAVTLLASDFLLVVATSFLGTSFAVAGAVSVLRLAAALARKRGVDNIEKLSLAGFHLQQGQPQRRVEVVALPAGPAEKSRELSTMERFGGDASSGLGATHPPAVHNEGQGHAEDESLRQIVQHSSCDKGLERSRRFRNDDHCESFPWPERISMI